MTSAGKTEASVARSEAPVGKNELLAWAQKTSGLPCAKIEDLKSGEVVFSVMRRIFPRLSKRHFRVIEKPRFAHEEQLNWDAVSQMVRAVKLPSELYDREGLQGCRFRPVYNLLVALFFLNGVSTDSNFTADFSHPIDGSLANFLQVPSTRACFRVVPYY